jgi:hypothetical protein
MPTLPTHQTRSTDRSNKNHELNEFAKIEGLGSVMLRWLRESFNVDTVADLANLSVNLVVARLRDEEKPFCQGEIERWIEQAKEFTVAQSSWQTFATFIVSLQFRQMGEQTEQRTTAYFLEADRKKIWSGIECHGVYELMRDQLQQTFQIEPEGIVQMETEIDDQSTVVESQPNSPVESELEPETIAQVVDSETQATSEESAIAQVKSDPDQPLLPIVTPVEVETTRQPATEQPLPPATIKITQIAVCQPITSGKPVVVDMTHKELPVVLQKNQPFQLEVTLALMGEGATDLTKQQVPYRVEVNERNRTTLELLPPHFTTSSLVEGEFTYKSLVESIVQEPGLYTMQIVAKPDHGYIRTDFFEIPFVRVV